MVGGGIGSQIFNKAVSSPTIWKRGGQAVLAYGLYRKFKTSPAMFRTAVRNLTVGVCRIVHDGNLTVSFSPTRLALWSDCTPRLFAAQNYNVRFSGQLPLYAWNCIMQLYS